MILVHLCLIQVAGLKLAYEGKERELSSLLCKKLDEACYDTGNLSLVVRSYHDTHGLGTGIVRFLRIHKS